MNRFKMWFYSTSIYLFIMFAAILWGLWALGFIVPFSGLIALAMIFNARSESIQ